MVTQEKQIGKKIYGGFNLTILKVKQIYYRELKFTQ